MFDFLGFTVSSIVLPNLTSRQNIQSNVDIDSFLCNCLITRQYLIFFSDLQFYYV